MFRTLIARNVRQGSRAFSTRSTARSYRMGVGALALGGAALMAVPFGVIRNDDKVEKKAKAEPKKPKETPEGTPEQAAAEGKEKEPTAEDYEGAAYNPITGEINWDCPCLGGMADGPCGEEFKEAFACFVYSESEPKGIDCIKKFEAMRTCFRRYPEHYKEQLFDDEQEEPLPAEQPEQIPSTDLRSTAESVIESSSVDTMPLEPVDVEVVPAAEKPHVESVEVDAVAVAEPVSDANPPSTQ